MKKLLALIMALALLATYPLTVLAETAETTNATEMPGEPPSGGALGDNMGTPPDGMPGEPPAGGMPGDGMGTPPDGMGGPGGEGGFGGNTPAGGRSSDFEYSAAKEITEASEASGEAFASDTADESALIVNTDADVALTDVTVTKTGDSNGGDNCNFYGLNAALLAMGGSTVTITGATITSDADGANGVFSYGGNGGRNSAEGDGTTVIISDTEIDRKSVV